MTAWDWVQLVAWWLWVAQGCRLILVPVANGRKPWRWYR